MGVLIYKNMKKNIIIVIIAILVIGGIVWLSESNRNSDIKTSEVPQITGETEESKPTIILYKSPTCGCCGQYAAYLEKNGFEVEIESIKDMGSIKEQFNIPYDVQSCHTAVIGDYFFEGHVPLEAVNKLLEEKPAIDGIALAGMPSGSPGMPGLQLSSFNIYAIKDGNTSEFMVIE